MAYKYDKDIGLEKKRKIKTTQTLCVDSYGIVDIFTSVVQSLEQFKKTSVQMCQIFHKGPQTLSIDCHIPQITISYTCCYNL